MMMMGAPKKKLASVIVDKLAQSTPVDMSKPEEDNSLGQKSAAEKVLKAIEAKDVSMLVSALNEFTDMKVDDDEPALPEV